MLVPEDEDETPLLGECGAEEVSPPDKILEPATRSWLFRLLGDWRPVARDPLAARRGRRREEVGSMVVVALDGTVEKPLISRLDLAEMKRRKK